MNPRLPTPATPKGLIFPTRSYAEHPQWIQLEEPPCTRDQVNLILRNRLPTIGHYASQGLREADEAHRRSEAWRYGMHLRGRSLPKTDRAVPAERLSH